VAYKNGATKKKKAAKRNGISVLGFGPLALAEGGVGALGGFLATGAAAEKIFRKYNTGWVGYGLTLLLGGVGGYAINRWAKRPVLATGFVFGTVGAVSRRVYEEKVVKILPAAVHMLTGEKALGDVAFSPQGIRALSGYYRTSGGDTLEIGERLGTRHPVLAAPVTRRSMSSVA